MEGLERLASKRDYATARLTIIWLWQSAQVIQAVTRDIQADLEAGLPEIKQTLSQYERERAMLSDARGLDEGWRNEKLAMLDLIAPIKTDCRAQRRCGCRLPFYARAGRAAELAPLRPYCVAGEPICLRSPKPTVQDRSPSRSKSILPTML